VPAQVPPGYTRGPILFVGALLDARASARMLQSFWDEAGSYGARVLIIAAASADPAQAVQMRAWFAESEVDSVDILPVTGRQSAHDPALVAQVDAATGILITDGSPLRFAATLGGTPVAQAIRRANARGRVVAGVGQGGAVLCQHMLVPDSASENSLLSYRARVRFAPGLGLVNRITLGCAMVAGAQLRVHLPCLLTAVAYNPFLIGVALDPNSGIVLYANSTLEVFGPGSALIVDGWRIEYSSIAEGESQDPPRVVGAQVHMLEQGFTFNLDTHLAEGPSESEIPQSGYEAFTSF